MTVIPFPRRDDHRVHVDDPAREARGLVVGLAITAVFWLMLALVALALGWL